jgi:hypothetical protein
MMKRLLVPLLVVLALLAGVIYWSARPRGFATPGQCLEAYRDALAAGDQSRYLGCLAPPLRAKIQEEPEEHFQAKARRFKEHIKNWGQSLESEQDSAASVLVDEVSMLGTAQRRYRLERSASGWLIAAIEPPKDVPTPVPFGTHISKVPEDK